MSFNVSHISNLTKSETIIDKEVVIEKNGFHYFGQSSGKGNQTIADCSKFKSISLEVETSIMSPGRIFLCFYSTLGQTYGFPFDPNVSIALDEKVSRVIILDSINSNEKQKYVYRSNDYTFLNDVPLGVTVFFESPQIGSKIKIRMVGEV